MLQSNATPQIECWRVGVHVQASVSSWDGRHRSRTVAHCVFVARSVRDWHRIRRGVSFCSATISVIALGATAGGDRLGTTAARNLVVWSVYSIGVSSAVGACCLCKIRFQREIRIVANQPADAEHVQKDPRC